MAFFSIIIPTLNEEKNLPHLLESLVHQTDKDFEVIISDGGSKDNTPKIAERFAKNLPGFKFFVHNLKGVGAARNFGAKKASGPFLLFLDADVQIDRKFLAKLKTHILLNKLEAATVWNRTISKNLSSRFILWLLNIGMTVFQKIKPGASGTCIVIKRKVFQKIGGFDPKILFGEDFNLIQRANELKIRFMVFKEPILYVSTRRFEKEGLIVSLYKSIKALIHQIFLGPIKKPIFEYEMGGQYFKSRKRPKT